MFDSCYSVALKRHWQCMDSMATARTKFFTLQNEWMKSEVEASKYFDQGFSLPDIVKTSHNIDHELHDDVHTFKPGFEIEREIAHDIDDFSSDVHNIMEAELDPDTDGISTNVEHNDEADAESNASLAIEAMNSLTGNTGEDIADEGDDAEVDAEEEVYDESNI